MKKIICKKEYDTETATLIKAYSFGQMGDPTGYEADLYQTPEGLYFLIMDELYNFLSRKSRGKYIILQHFRKNWRFHLVFSPSKRI